MGIVDWFLAICLAALGLWIGANLWNERKTLTNDAGWTTSGIALVAFLAALRLIFHGH